MVGAILSIFLNVMGFSARVSRKYNFTIKLLDPELLNPKP